MCPSTVRKKLDIIHRENEQVLNNHQLILLDSLPQEVCLKSDFAGCSTLSSFRLRKKLMTLSTECAFSGGQKNPRTEGRNKDDLREWKNLDNSSRQGYDQQGLSAKEILFLRDQIIGISYIATQTRKSLVKDERFIRAVWIAEIMPCIKWLYQVTESTSFRI